MLKMNIVLCAVVCGMVSFSNGLQLRKSEGNRAPKSAVNPYQRITFNEYYAEPLTGSAPDITKSALPSRLTITEAPSEVTTFEDLEVATVTPTTAPKRKKGTTPAPEENNENNTEDQFRTLDRYISAYNSFFPIILGGYPNAKSVSADLEGGSYPQGATAIANSYSTGKGGIASSHATAFADPALRTILKSGYFNHKTGKILKN